MTPSAHPGMGARVSPGGVSFRVWAPFATGVAVTVHGGSRAGAYALEPEGTGVWSAEVPGVTVGDEYLFRLSTPAGVLTRNDPYARDVTSSVGRSVVTASDDVAWSATDFRMPGWDELVVYEVHVGTFNDAPGGPPGGFASVRARLDYLRDLGVTAIELMPSAEFAGDFSWGYNPAHIFSVERAYGGRPELLRLVDAAHQRGIAVIGDVVYNHLGPSDLDLWQFDGWSQNGGGGIYFYNDGRAQTPWGHTRPDYGRPEVVAFLRDNVRSWLEDYRLDGLRWDMTAYIRNVYGGNDPWHDIPDGWRLLQSLTSDTRERQPWKIHIAEDLQGVDAMTEAVPDGGAGFDSQWDAGFVHPVRGALEAVMDGARNMGDVSRAVAGGPGGITRRVVYTESHDEVANGKTRLPTAIAPADPGGWYARKRSTLGAVLVLTSPGIPMLFQGQEILEDRFFHDDAPIDWTKLTTHAGIHRMYRDLVRLRRDADGTTRGLRGDGVGVHHVNDDDNVVAYHRWHRGGARDDVVVVVNVSHRAFDDYRVGMPRAGVWTVRLDTDWRRYGSDFGTPATPDATTAPWPRDGMPCSTALRLAPYSALVLSQDT